MAYQQVRDVVDQVATFHRRLRRYVDSSKRLTGDERAQRLLEHVSRHEETIERSLEAYDPAEAKDVLDAWIQFVPTRALEEALEAARLEPETPVGEAVERVLEVDRQLLSLYRQLAGQLAAPRARELFESLAELEGAKSEEVARGALELEQQGA